MITTIESRLAAVRENIDKIGEDRRQLTSCSEHELDEAGRLMWDYRNARRRLNSENADAQTVADFIRKSTEEANEILAEMKDTSSAVEHLFSRICQENETIRLIYIETYQMDGVLLLLEESELKTRLAEVLKDISDGLRERAYEVEELEKEMSSQVCILSNVANDAQAEGKSKFSEISDDLAKLNAGGLDELFCRNLPKNGGCTDD